MLQALDQMTLHPLFIGLLEEADSFLVIVLFCFHHVIKNDENTMSHGDGSPFASSSFGKATVLLSQIRLGPTHRMGSLHQGSSHIRIPFPDPATAPFASTFIVSRQSRPAVASTHNVHNEPV